MPSCDICHFEYHIVMMCFSKSAACLGSDTYCLCDCTICWFLNTFWIWLQVLIVLSGNQNNKHQLPLIFPCRATQSLPKSLRGCLRRHSWKGTRYLCEPTALQWQLLSSRYSLLVSGCAWVSVGREILSSFVVDR